jgi:outer membrane protein
MFHQTVVRLMKLLPMARQNCPPAQSMNFDKRNCCMSTQRILVSEPENIYIFRFQFQISSRKTIMRIFRTALLTVLSACALTVSSVAADSAPANPTLLPVATQAVAVQPQKPAEILPMPPTTRLGHVDVERIASQSETAKSGQEQFGELKKKLQTQIDSKRKQLEKLQSSLEAKIKTLPPAQREAKAKEFQKKVEEFQKFGLNAEKELKAKQEELSEKMFRAIEQASQELGKAKGLALVIIKRELLYLGNGIDAQDVTDDVIKQIDSHAPKK